MREQRGRCALSGLHFRAEHFKDALVKYPFGPSLDRIVPKRGYVAGNVRLVCTAANFARNQWGDEALRRLARGIVAMEREAELAWFHDRERQLAAAQAEAATLSGDALRQKQRRIAGLKAALTKGPARGRAAGRFAAEERKASRRPT